MASSSSSTPSQKYEVFLSFRGEDTRYSFVSHLHKALNQRGIVTFFDELDLKRGQSISPDLLKSIKESKFAIIIFSKNYASSTWCLDELVKIMECRSKYSQTVMPIFYDVDPSDVRKQKNSFAESFSIHEVNFKDNMEKVQIWKENLREAASISGHDLSQRNVTEASSINKIVDHIFSELPRKASTKGLVGMENHFKKLKSLLAEEPNGVRFVGIWGMGGIGKTTTARAIFDELIGGFEGGCFLRDVYKRGMVDLQGILLSEVVKANIKVNDEDEGSYLISNRLGSKRLLLVLDDVNDEKQIEALAGGCDWFGDGSIIIITTRDKHLLNDVNILYEMEILLDNEAIELFSLHAFKKSHPPENFVQLSYRVLKYADGLPLALKVLGSHLSGRQRNEWESTLDRLKYAPEDKINESLKISFDGLNNNQQNIFLHIACFFRRRLKYKVIDELDNLGFHSTDGIKVLQEKSLIHILYERSDSFIAMHDLIGYMGQNIVRQKADMDPGKYSRLWDAKDIIDVIINVTGSSEVEGLVFRNLKSIKLKFNEKVFRNMSRLRLLDIGAGADSVISHNSLHNSMRWLYWWKYSCNSSHFYLPNSLRILHWSNYPSKSLPVDFKPRNLVSLDLIYSPSLQTCPDISDMPNLETLILSHCKNLLDVHPSVGVHKKISLLDLSHCLKIKKIPGTMQMKSLETLRLGYCRRLQSLPEFHSNMTSLRTINLNNSGIKYLPWSLGRLTRLQEINLQECGNLRALPNNLCGLKYLESVKLSWCSKLKFFFENPDDEVVHFFDTQPFSVIGKRAENEDASKILTAFLSLPSLRTLCMDLRNGSELILPESNGCFDSLEELVLINNNFVSLPDSMNRFSCLQNLNLISCRNLEALTELPPRIKTLTLGSYKALTRIPNLVDLLNKYDDLELLSLDQCEKFVQKQDQVNSTQTNAMGDLVPQFLLGLSDWGTASNILCNRKKVVQVYLSCNYHFNWLHKSTGPQATVTLSPSSFYNDKLRGFVICAITCGKGFTVVTGDGLVPILKSPRSWPLSDLKYTAFFFIPIGKITRSMDRKEKKDYSLFDVAQNSYRVINEMRWGIGLVYDGEVDMDFSDLTLTNSPTNLNECPGLKVCVAPKIVK